MWNTLNDYGCTPRKSNTLLFPNIDIFKNESLIIPFIRGYFDGDGCLTNTKEHPKVSFLGTEQFLTKIKNYLFNYSINSGKLVIDPREEFTRTLNISRTDVFKFLHLIYDDSVIYLNRKYNKFLTFCRSSEKSDELLQTNIGELCDENTEINIETKESISS